MDKKKKRETNYKINKQTDRVKKTATELQLKKVSKKKGKKTVIFNLRISSNFYPHH